MRSLSGLLVAALLVLAAPQGFADETTVTDATDDVYGSVDTGFEEVEPVGTHVNTDLRRVRVDHREHRVVIKVRYVELTRGLSTSVTFRGFLNLPAGTDDIGFDVDIKPTIGRAHLVLTDSFGEVACPGATVGVHDAKDLVKIRIPRACLGDPAWVRYRGDAESRDKADDRLFLDWGNTSGDYNSPSKQTGRLYAG